MASTVWPFIPFVALRAAQIFFAIIVLGLSAYLGSVATDSYGETNYWSAWFSMVTALFTLIGATFLLVTFFIAPAFVAPLICLGLDAFLFLFWLISLAGFANQSSLYLALGSCSGYYGGKIPLCGEIKGNMAMIVFEFLLFMGTLIFSAIWFWRERSGKTTGTTNPEGGISSGAIAGAPGAPHGSYPMQQPPVPNPAPVQYTQQPQYPPAQTYQQ